MTRLAPYLPLLSAAAIVACVSATASAQYDDRYSPIYRQGQVATPNNSYSDRAYQLPDRASDYARARQGYTAALDARQDAQSRLGRTTSRLYSTQMSSPEAREAYEQLQQARQAYQQARENALQPLTTNQQFQDARQRAERVDRTIEQVRYQPGTTQRDIVDLSEEQLRWAERAGDFKTEATESPEVQRTRREMVDAYMRLQQFQQQTLADVRTSPDVREAWAAVRETETRWYDARGQLAASRAGYREAVDQRSMDRRDDDGGRYAPWMYGGVYDSGFGDGVVGGVSPGNPDGSIGIGGGFSGQAPSFEGEVPSFGTPENPR